MKRTALWYLGLILTSVLFVIDRLTKWSFYELGSAAEPVVFFNGLVSLQLHINTRLALSLPLFPFLYYPVLVIIITALIIMLLQTIRTRKVVEFIFILFILVGAVSNIIDRIFFGGVIDFINISIGNIFNLADIYIIVGIVGWSILSLKHDKHSSTKEKISAGN